MYFSDTRTLMLSTWKMTRKMLACYTTPVPSSRGVEGLDWGEQVEENAHPKGIIWSKK